MREKVLKSWKKVGLKDITYVVSELKVALLKPICLFLEGDVGAGKTTLCQFFMGAEEILSPTYSLLNETASAVHGDFYRLENTEDIYNLEIDLYLEKHDIFIVEWALKYKDILNDLISDKFNFYCLKVSYSEDQSEYRDYELSEIIRYG